MGDMMMHANQISTASKGDKFDFSSYFKLVKDKIAAADIAVANMEFTLGGEPYTGYPCFSAPDYYADYLAETGFDVFLAANNHIFDKGSNGARRTLEIYQKMEQTGKIKFTGLAENEEDRAKRNPLIINNNGISVAFVNFTYGTNAGYQTIWPKTTYMGERKFIAEAMKKAEEGADITIVLPHWGQEYQLHHSQEQEDIAKWLVSIGADAIIGSHPHVVQDTTTIGQVPVAYSLGNAVSNMSASNTQIELMATLTIVRIESGECKLLPIEYTWLWCSRPGGYSNNYVVVPVEEQIDNKAQWQGQWEHDKMMTTYSRVKYKK